MTYFVSTGRHRNDLHTVCSIPYHARPFNRRDRRNYVFALSVCACVCTCSPRILQPACRLQFIFVVFFVYTTAFPAGTSRDLPLAVLSLLWHSSSVLYSGWSDVTESMVTTLTPFCAYNMMKVRCVKRRRSIVVFPNKIEPVTLRKCRYDPWLTDKAYLIAITVTDISQSFTYTTAAKINRHRYGTKLRHPHHTYTASRTGVFYAVQLGLVRFPSNLVTSQLSGL